MPFLLLLYLTLICMEDDWRAWDSFGESTLSASLTWLAVGAWVGVAFLGALGVRRRLRRDPVRREPVLRLYGAFRAYHSIGLYIIFAVCLYLLGWGNAVQSLAADDTRLFPGGELLVLAPFLAGLIGSWLVLYDAERAIHDTGPAADGAHPFWTRWGYLGFHVRHTLALVFIPLLLLMVERGVSRLVPESAGWSYASVLGFLAALSVFVCLPWVLRLALGLRPLPAGPERTRLEALAGRLNFRCTDILIWHTRGGIANAMVAGVVPWLRYVVLTDRLLAELTPEEVDAVFGHEVGHVKHHHMPYYVGFFVTSLTVLWMAALLLMPQADYLRRLAVFPLVGMLAAYTFVVFGFLTRRCERQADIYGCRAASCGRPGCAGHAEEFVPPPGSLGLCPTGIRTFIEALEKVARLNGISRDRPGFLLSWQHDTIARRVEFLQSMLSDPRLEPRFQRKVALVKWGLLLGLGGALAVLLTVT